MKHSLKDALGAFFQPIRNDDPRLDFYTVYKREAAEYDIDYVKKYDEDLNTTLIFVRRLSCTTLLNNLTLFCRRVYSLLSVQLSSSMFTPSFNPTPTTNQQRSFVRSSSPLITPRFRTHPSSFHLSKCTPQTRSSLPPFSCTQAL